MRVLASVYACSPYDGSERAVGWNWIKELDKYHEITALTSHVYKSDIEDYISKHPGELKARFVFIDVPMTSWHKGYRLERIYYILWQREAERVAEKLIKNEHYDLVHHITYVTCVLPTYMYKLNLPLLIGPVAGGEMIPSIINYPMDFKCKLFENVRRLAQLFFSSTSNFKKMTQKAKLILTTTEETARLIPYQNKTEIFQAAGLNDDFIFTEPPPKPERVARFLMIGRMLYLKGYELGIQAFLKELDNGMKAELTIVGDTEGDKKQEAYKKHIMKKCKGRDEIKFVDKVNYSDMCEFYDNFDVLINCALRDSGCFVVMEAMSRGLPVILVDSGGPKVNTTSETAIKIKPESMSDMIYSMGKAIRELSENKVRREIIGKAAREYAKNHFAMTERTKRMNHYYEQILKG